MNNQVENNLGLLYLNQFGELPENIELLPVSGSQRKYYRLSHKTNSVIGTFNKDVRENNAFIAMSTHFYRKGLAVPKIIAFDPDNFIYLQEDLGDVTLYGYLKEKQTASFFSPDVISIYKGVIDELIKFQLFAGEGFDYSLCYPRARFDKQSMMWDLYYFKHYFIKLAGIGFDEQQLEDDFNALSDFLLLTETGYFMYRDFQSRNILLYKGKPYFVDYQGGRQGALQYDLASLLYDAKAEIPTEVREDLLNYYIEKLKIRIEINSIKFIEFYYGYVLIRILQACGAYGYRGFFERKQHFLLSIPYALKNLRWLLENHKLSVNLPALNAVIENLIDSPRLKQLSFEKPLTGLTVQVCSFSYKRNIPLDNSGNGGGFVFDCRFLPNPGRYPEYKDLTGFDDSVIDYLEKQDEVILFARQVKDIIDNVLNNYLHRQFTSLMVNFGCTGGRHRSVYYANKLSDYLKSRTDINVVLHHTELEILKDK